MAAVITSAKLDVLFTGAQLKYQAAYEATEVWWDQVATKFTSNTEQETYAWHSRVPRLRKWVGPRIANSVAAYQQTIANESYEDTIELPRTKILDDSYGVFDINVQAMAGAVKKWPDQLMVDVLRNAQNTTVWDNKSFFATDHPIDPLGDTTAQRNYWSSGKALTPDNFIDVRQTMIRYKGEDGFPLYVVPNLLVVPPQLELTARRIVESPLIADQTYTGTTMVGGQTNVLKGMAQVLMIPELGDDPTTWYLLDTRKVVKPFGFQLRQDAEFTSVTDPASASVFNNNSFQFGVWTRGAAFPTLWFLAAKAVG